MKKTLFILTAMLLFVGATFAQRATAMKVDLPLNTETATLQATAAHAPTTSRDVIFFENFNTGTGYDNAMALPAGWVLLGNSNNTTWRTVDYLVSGTPPVPTVFSYDNSIFAVSLWSSGQARDSWMISPGFTLAAGESYTVSFWLKLGGFQSERDHIHVKIGQAQTIAGMTDAIYSNTNTAIAEWTLMSFTYTPTASGTFYIGFHANTPNDLGNDIGIDDVKIEGAGGPPPACDPATNLNVTYTDDCKANLTWNAPAKGRSTLLWNNTDINIPSSGNNGLISTYWAGANSWVFTGDDFIATGNWIIEKITTRGFQSQDATQPTKLAIAIYADNGNKPGTEIFRETAINVTWDAPSGFANCDIILPTPFTLPNPGKYWIAIAGAYDGPVNTTTARWNIASGTTAVGSNFHLHDPGNLFGQGTEWYDALPLVTPLRSMYFTLEGQPGEVGPDEYEYNVYRDGVLIKGNHPTNSYTDETFDASSDHTWSVKVICEAGGESDAASKYMDACEDGDCNPARNLNAQYVVGSGCTKVDLTWNPPAAKSGIISSNNTQSLETMRSGSSATTGQPAIEMIAASATSNNATRGTELLNESFPTGTVPAGWLNLDSDGDGYKWQFELRSNNEPQNCPPMPSEGRTDAYCINSASYYNCVGPLSPNNWLITPQLELTGNTELTWWVKVFDSGYRDKYGVFISTTGTNPSDFTEIFTETPPASQSTNWAQRTVTIDKVGPCYIAFRHYGSTDLYILGIDDIIVTALTPVYYNIYRNNQLIEANYPGTTYTDNEVDGTQANTWKVVVVCGEGGVSSAISKTLEPCPTDCAPATMTQVTPSGNGMYVAWQLPATRAEVIITQGGDYNQNGVGAGSASFGVYHRFTPADLVAVNGAELTKFVFAPMFGTGEPEPGHNYTIRFYQGGSASPYAPGTMVYEQALTHAQLSFGEETEITLTNPVIIDGTKELWIGYHCINRPEIPPQGGPNGDGKFPAGTDGLPRKEGLGNIMFFNNQWTTLHALAPTLVNNWCIKGKVQYTPTTVNLYRDNVKIQSNIEATSYVDLSLAAGTYCYTVEVNCPNGSTSPLAAEMCGTLSINEVKTTFSIVPNPATNSITIAAGNDFKGIEVVSFLGQTVLAQSTNGNSVTLDISTLTNGVYFVRVISDEGVSVKKFVKQ